MPRDTTRPGASGRFLLRLDPGLHDALRRAAVDAGLSLNEYCARKLASPGVSEGAAANAVTRAAAVCGEHLRGVAVFGSWARGTAPASSDVDLLVVVAPALPVTRELYRAWDAAPVWWEGRPVEPHFVRLPPAHARPSGLWAEVAIDGIVLFDPDFELARRLAAFRRRVAEGRLRLGRAHGQAYWVDEDGDREVRDA